MHHDFYCRHHHRHVSVMGYGDQPPSPVRLLCHLRTLCRILYVCLAGNHASSHYCIPLPKRWLSNCSCRFLLRPHHGIRPISGRERCWQCSIWTTERGSPERYALEGPGSWWLWKWLWNSHCVYWSDSPCWRGEFLMEAVRMAIVPSFASHKTVHMGRPQIEMT